jgi:hypothetical protein
VLAGGLVGLWVDQANASVVGLLGGAFAIQRDRVARCGFVIAWLRGSQEGQAPR